MALTACMGMDDKDITELLPSKISSKNICLAGIRESYSFYWIPFNQLLKGPKADCSVNSYPDFLPSFQYNGERKQNQKKNAK